jgi:hypothetical protein
MSDCDAEKCEFRTGHGCLCAVMGIERNDDETGDIC